MIRRPRPRPATQPPLPSLPRQKLELISAATVLDYYYLLTLPSLLCTSLLALGQLYNLHIVLVLDLESCLSEAFGTSALLIVSHPKDIPP